MTVERQSSNLKHTKNSCLSCTTQTSHEYKKQ
uniref:Uncharacterized protein n=1 Tax=Arundo donax TaxID=35708 RepID=A0A0A8YFV7_ARUDO